MPGGVAAGLVFQPQAQAGLAGQAPAWIRRKSRRGRSRVLPASGIPFPELRRGSRCCRSRSPSRFRWGRAPPAPGTRYGPGVLDGGVAGPVEHRGLGLEAELVGGPAQVGFQHLAQVHARGHADGVEDDVNGSAVFQVGHILFGQDAGDHALVAVASGHLVAHGDFPGLGDPDADGLLDAGVQVVPVLAAQHLDVDDLAALAVGHAQGGVLNVAGLFAEDGAQAAFPRRSARSRPWE